MIATATPPSPVERFLDSFQDAVRGGRAKLLSADSDYDKAEVRRPSGRIDTVVRLAAVRARVSVTFRPPLPALGPRHELLMIHPRTRAPGLWLTGPGLDRHYPLDVIARCFGADQPLAGQIVLPEIAFHKALRDPAWGELTKAYRAACVTSARCDGLWFELLIDLEAT